MGENIKASFNLVSIRIVDLSVKLNDIKNLKATVSLRHNFSASFLYLNETDIIQLVLKVVISIPADEKELIQVADSKILFDFKVENIKEWMKDGKLIVPGKVAKTFILEGLSTARGIIWVKLSGTSLNNAVIPLIQDDAVESKDLEFVPQG